MLEFVTDNFWYFPSMTTCFIGFFTFVLLYWYTTRNHNYFKNLGIPYVKPYPLVGNVVQSIRDFTRTEIWRHKTLGPIFGHFEGNRAMLSVGDPDLLRDILIKDFHVFQARRTTQMGDEIFDTMMTTIQGDDWKRIRTIVSPTFTTGKIRRMIDIFGDCSKSLMKNFMQTEGEDVDLKRLYGAFTMDVIASSAFSTKIDSHNNPDNPFVREARNVFPGKISWRFIMFFMAPKLMQLLRISAFDPNGLKFFAEATRQIIVERKRTGQTRNDFLQLLLDTAEEQNTEQKRKITDGNEEEDMLNNYGEEPNTDHHIFKNATSVKKTLSMNELIGQCIVFFAAGYESTSSTLACCTFQLAFNQQIQDKARKEVDCAIQDCEGEITYEAVQKMKYLDNLISETLRYYPPIIRTERVAESDYKLGDTGITVPKGMIVTVPIYALNHDPKYFPQPEKFEPDRFTPEQKATRDQFAYLPFGGGPRNCIGMRFALMEVKVCLSYVLANFRIEMSPNTKVPLEFTFGQGLLQPSEVILRLEKREDSPLIK